MRYIIYMRDIQRYDMRDNTNDINTYVSATRYTLALKMNNVYVII